MLLYTEWFYVLVDFIHRPPTGALPWTPVGTSVCQTHLLHATFNPEYIPVFNWWVRGSLAVLRTHLHSRSCASPCAVIFLGRALKISTQNGHVHRCSSIVI